MTVAAKVRDRWMRADRVMRDGDGDWYMGWVENSYWPLTVLVRGESFEDAYGWLLTHPSIVSQIEVDPSDPWTVKDYGDVAEAVEQGRLDINDDGVLVDSEAVQLVGPLSVDFFHKES